MQNRTLAGVACLCLGVLVFSLQDAIIKAVSGTYALTEVVSIRCLVSLPILAVFVHVETGLSAILSRNLGQHILRSAIMLTAYTTYYMAFPALPLADAVALYFTVPLFMLAFAVPILGEGIGWRRISALLVGFVGVIVMLKPGAGLFEPAALLSLFSAAAYALSMVLARRMGGEEKASVMAFYQNAVYMTGALILAGVIDTFGWHQASHPSLHFLVRSWDMPTARDLALIASCGVIAAVGMVLLTQAYRLAKASVVGSFEYTGLVWAPLWGFLFFGEIPEVNTVAGAGLIIVAGLFALTSRAASEDGAAPSTQPTS